MTTDDQWRKLDPRTLLASTILIGGILAATAVPVAIGMLLGEMAPGWVAFWTVGGVIVGTAGTAALEWVRLAVTRYRIDDHRIERKIEFLGSSHTALATERVRNVEIAVNLVQKRIGVADVRLASGDSDGPRFTLQSVDREYAEALRRRLLAERATEDSDEIARLDPGWVRYAPLSLWTPFIGAVGYGLAFQVASWFDAVSEMLRWFWDTFGHYPIPLIVAGLLLVALVAGIIARVAIFVEGWWAYRLEHHDDGSAELRRGLLVNRHTSFDGRRIRGVTLHEPPGLRSAGAARLDVVAVGVNAQQSGNERQSPALVPASPEEVSFGVAHRMLGTPVPRELRTHPPAARRKRYLRAAAVTALAGIGTAVVAVVWPFLWWVPVATVVGVGALAAWIAHDNFRGLGHYIGPEVVAVRKGSVLRRTDVLQRDGVLGWNLRRSWFQKRAGLVTLVATSAAGSGAVRLPDVAAAGSSEIWSTAGDVWEHLRVRDGTPGGAGVPRRGEREQEV